METKHTPGPWKAVELDEYTVAIKTDRNHTHECIHIADANIMSGNLAEEVPMAIANAKLIAAAPELLEALKRIGEIIKDHDSKRVDEIVCLIGAEIYASIKKATE